MHGLSQGTVELPNRHRWPGAYATRAGPYRRATQQHLANSNRTSAALPLLPVNGGSLRNGDGWCGMPAGPRLGLSFDSFGGVPAGDKSRFPLPARDPLALASAPIPDSKGEESSRASPRIESFSFSRSRRRCARCLAQSPLSPSLRGFSFFASRWASWLRDRD